MARPWTGYLAGAAFALYAATGVAAYAQGAPAPDGARDRAVREADGDATSSAERQVRRDDRQVRHEERRIVIQDGDRHFEMAGGHRMGGRHADMAEHLRTMLQLKPSQEAALAAYVAAVRPERRDPERMVEMSRSDAPKTTTERLAEMERRLADRQAEARARIEATRRFYAQLEPSQKKVFDEMPMLMIGPIGPMGPMMMHGPMKIRFEHPPAPPIPPTPPPPPRAPAPPRL